MALSTWRRRMKKENASPSSPCDNSEGGNVRVLQGCAGDTSQDLNSMSKRQVSVASSGSSITHRMDTEREIDVSEAVTRVLEKQGCPSVA